MSQSSKEIGNSSGLLEQFLPLVAGVQGYLVPGSCSPRFELYLVGVNRAKVHFHPFKVLLETPMYQKD